MEIDESKSALYTLGIVQVGRGAALPHLLFVDDVLLFCIDTKREGKYLQGILQTYNKATGMETNAPNSALYTSRMDDDLTQDFERLFLFQHLDLMDGMKFLGFTLKDGSLIGCG